MTNSNNLVVRRTSAQPSAVREWAAENGFTTGSRGRYSSELVSAYNKANKGSRRYVPQQGYPVKTKTVKVGKRERTVPVAEARQVLREHGEAVGTRGRLSTEQVLKALELASQ